VGAVIGLVVVLGLVLLVGMILAGLRAANVLLKRTQAAQNEAMEQHRSGLLQITGSASLERESVELARRAAVAAEASAQIAAEIRDLLIARDRDQPRS